MFHGPSQKQLAQDVIEDRNEEGTVLDWFVHRVLRAAGVVAEWFLPAGHQQFGLVQLGAALLLVTAIIALAAFWPKIRDARRDRGSIDDQT